MPPFNALTYCSRDVNRLRSPAFGTSNFTDQNSLMASLERQVLDSHEVSHQCRDSDGRDGNGHQAEPKTGGGNDGFANCETIHDQSALYLIRPAKLNPGVAQISIVRKHQFCTFVPAPLYKSLDLSFIDFNHNTGDQPQGNGKLLGLEQKAMPLPLNRS